MTRYGHYNLSKSTKKDGKSHKSAVRVVLFVLLLTGLIFVIVAVRSNHIAANQQAATSVNKVVTQPNVCLANTLDQNIIVSISGRHLWACRNAKSSYDSAIITGMENLAADRTPLGTYHIYAKQADLHLRGADSTGSWDDPVSYWLSFLDNQYGTYGFHDATWRPISDFGNIDPDSSKGSHGCVELPLAAAKWLYGWATVGTTVTIEP